MRTYLSTWNFLLYYLGCGTAAPAGPVLPHHLGARDTPFSNSLPNITDFATGGTIAGSPASNTATTGCAASALVVDILIQAAPELWNISNVKGVQVAIVDSGSITLDIPV